MRAALILWATNRLTAAIGASQIAKSRRGSGSIEGGEIMRCLIKFQCEPYAQCSKLAVNLTVLLVARKKIKGKVLGRFAISSPEQHSSKMPFARPALGDRAKQWLRTADGVTDEWSNKATSL
jgi:hypothetical protein